MGGTFNIQKVEASGGRLVVRCVRDYFYGDGLMADDVWIWEIEEPEEGKAELLRAMIGKQCYVYESNEGKSLLVAVEDTDEKVAVRGKHIGKKEEMRGPEDFKDLVAQLSREIGREVGNHGKLRQKLSAVATVVEHMIDNKQRRVEFVKEREPEKAKGLSREIEDLRAVLRKLRE